MLPHDPTTGRGRGKASETKRLRCAAVPATNSKPAKLDEIHGDPDIPYQVADSDGLVIEVKPSGKQSWIYMYRFNGKPEKLVIDQYPEITLKDVHDRLLEARHMVANNESPAKQEQLVRKHVNYAT